MCSAAFAVPLLTRMFLCVCVVVCLCVFVFQRSARRSARMAAASPPTPASVSLAGAGWTAPAVREPICSHTNKTEH